MSHALCTHRKRRIGIDDSITSHGEGEEISRLAGREWLNPPELGGLTVLASVSISNHDGTLLHAGIGPPCEVAVALGG
ncbi:hypothetical protein [Pseudomonas sp. M47T1]|uniref:hypothetical protein n=1 Tax=Pseudomonas sp. M47T1 TaxID=1179778 RepID=UPI0012F873D6